VAGLGGPRAAAPDIPRLPADALDDAINLGIATVAKGRNGWQPPWQPLIWLYAAIL
jgi:hypothetical protein